MGNAREMANKYKELEKKLEEKLNEFNGYYTQAATELNETHSCLTVEADDAEGRIKTDFINKEGIWNSEYKNILIEMQYAKIRLSLRKDEARSKKIYWETKAEIEEMEGVH